MACPQAAVVLSDLEDAFRKAVLTGDWTEFDSTRDRLEQHYSDELERVGSSGDGAVLTRRESGVRSPERAPKR